MKVVRWERVRERLNRLNLHAFLFQDIHNIRYLTGFTGSDGAVVAALGELTLLTDSRYTTQAQEEFAGGRVIEYRKASEGIAAELKRLKVTRVGFEAEAATYAEWDKLKSETGDKIELIPFSSGMDDLRAIKDEEEINLIRRAAAIGDRALNELFASDLSGITEIELAWRLEMNFHNGGAEEKAFPLIVASGPRGALPHGAPSERVPERGEMMVVDFGVRVGGYHSDETRTVSWGAPDELQRKIYDLTARAQERALKAIKPGASLRAIDAAGRLVIEEAGYGKFFGHGMGHGVGLNIHEPPRVSPFGEGTVEPGMVFTVEPGIYLPGRFGVRIEDIVLVTESGYELLTPPASGLREI